MTYAAAASKQASATLPPPTTPTPPSALYPAPRNILQPADAAPHPAPRPHQSPESSERKGRFAVSKTTTSTPTKPHRVATAGSEGGNLIVQKANVRVKEQLEDVAVDVVKQKEKAAQVRFVLSRNASDLG